MNENFVVDAWLANWDVVGQGYDNLTVKDGKAFRLDFGGALRYRALGGEKGGNFSNKVGELETFLDASINPQSSDIFKGINRAEMIQGAKKVVAFDDDKIYSLVTHTLQSGDEVEAAAVRNTLIARRDWIMHQFPEAIPEPLSNARIVGYFKHIYGDEFASKNNAFTEADKQLFNQCKTVANLSVYVDGGRKHYLEEISNYSPS